MTPAPVADQNTPLRYRATSPDTLIQKNATLGASHKLLFISLFTEDITEMEMAFLRICVIPNGSLK